MAHFRSDGSKENGAQWTDSLGSILSSSTIADGVLYVGSADGNA